MQRQVVRLTRQELYEKMWSRPANSLAEEFGISGRGLGNPVCGEFPILKKIAIRHIHAAAALRSTLNRRSFSSRYQENSKMGRKAWSQVFEQTQVSISNPLAELSQPRQYIIGER